MTGTKRIAGALTGASVLFLALALFMGVFSGQASALVATDAEIDASPETETVAAGTAPRYLADGTYVLNIAKDTSLVADLPKSSKKAGANVAFVQDSAAKSQQWTFVWDDRFGAYRIMNANSGLYLTTKAAKAGKKLVSQAKYSDTNKKQLWTLEKSGKGYKILSLAKSSVGLGVASAKVQSGTFLTTQTVKARKCMFYVLPVDESLIAPAETKRVPESLDGRIANITYYTKTSLKIGIESDDTRSGATVTMGKDSGSQSQKWCLKAVDVDAGIYTIVNLGSGKALQVANNGRHVGTGVVQGNPASSDKTQQWWIRYANDVAYAKYTFTSCYNGLTLRCTSLKSGANACLSYEGCNNRIYKLNKVSVLDDGFYQVSSMKKPDLVWGIANGSSSKNKQLQLGNLKKTSLWQKFKVECVGEGVYAIRSVTSNRYVGEVDGKIVQGTREGDDSQRWTVEWSGTGFVLKNVSTGHYLSISGSAKSGAKLVATESCKPALANCLFTKCRLIESGTYFLTESGNANKTLGISQAKAKKEKAPAGVFKKANVQNYKFDLSYVGKDSSGNEIYKIVNTYSRKGLTVSGSKVVQKKSSNSKAQRWVAFVTSTGMIAFKNVATGKAISLSSKSVKAAGYSDSSSSRFRWNLVATTSLTPPQVKAYDMLTATFSNTNYAITVDLSNHRVRVWKRANASSPWTLKYDWICSNGARLTPTPAVNVLSTGGKRFENPMYNPEGILYNNSFWYMTYIADGKYFHTPLYRKGSMTKLKDARMGRSISHGCVRLQTKNAIWIYKNIKKGTRIITYY